jgi:hypothetical protein
LQPGYQTLRLIKKGCTCLEIGDHRRLALHLLDATMCPQQPAQHIALLHARRLFRTVIYAGFLHRLAFGARALPMIRLHGCRNERCTDLSSIGQFTQNIIRGILVNTAGLNGHV